MQLLSALQWRYAARQFTEERLPAIDVESLIDATRLSASSYGLQPYRLIQVDSREIREQLLAHAMGQNKILDCSHLLVLAAETDPGDATVDQHMSRLGRAQSLAPQTRAGMSKHMKTTLAKMAPSQRLTWAKEQVFIALGTLLTAAAVMKIDSCPMTGFEAEGFDQVLGLSQRGLTATALCALGRRHPADDHANLPKVRLAPREFVRVV